MSPARRQPVRAVGRAAPGSVPGRLRCHPGPPPAARDASRRRAGTRRGAAVVRLGSRRRQAPLRRRGRNRGTRREAEVGALDAGTKTPSMPEPTLTTYTHRHSSVVRLERRRLVRLLLPWAAAPLLPPALLDHLEGAVGADEADDAPVHARRPPYARASTSRRGSSKLQVPDTQPLTCYHTSVSRTSVGGPHRKQ